MRITEASFFGLTCLFYSVGLSHCYLLLSPAIYSFAHYFLILQKLKHILCRALGVVCACSQCAFRVGAVGFPWLQTGLVCLATLLAMQLPHISSCSCSV